MQSNPQLKKEQLGIVPFSVVPAIELKKKKKKRCCEKFKRKGKRCGSCPLTGCA
jgi:hypothetical protein